MGVKEIVRLRFSHQDTMRTGRPRDTATASVGFCLWQEGLKGSSYDKKRLSRVSTVSSQCFLASVLYF